MKKSIVIIVIMLLTNYIFSHEKILFHEYSPTASNWDIIQWNISDTTNVIWVLKEVVDKQGRVKELVFLENGKVDFHGLCYLTTRVTYEYQDRKIIERFYIADDPMLATECEMNYMSIYHLDEENYIEKKENFFAFDFSDMDSISIKIIKEEIPEHNTVIPGSVPITMGGFELEPIQLEINYYYFSYAKMNGIYPISRNYILKNDDDYYYGDEPERTSIVNGINKLKKHR